MNAPEGEAAARRRKALAEARAEPPDPDVDPVEYVIEVGGLAAHEVVRAEPPE